MRIFFTAGAFIAAVSFISQPAMAALCGPSSDVAAVEIGSVANFNANLPRGGKKINKTYVMAVVVLGVYAQVDISYAGQMSDFWIKKSGNWTYAGHFAPKGWPVSVRNKLAAMSNQRANGSKQCTNPQFVPRGSG